MTDKLATTESQVPAVPQELTMAQVVQRRAKIVEAMNRTMKKGTHYDTIPGTPSPTLFQPGADLLNTMFLFRPEFEIVEKINQFDPDFIKYEVLTRLYHIPSGNMVSTGMGSANSREGKYRWRYEEEETDIAVPGSYWDLSKEKRGTPQGKNILAEASGLPAETVRVKKNDSGNWVIATRGERVENDNIYDLDNTILKIACKRSKVHAVLNATAATDMFTQDMEDLKANWNAVKDEYDTITYGHDQVIDVEHEEEKPAPAPKPKQKKKAAPKKKKEAAPAPEESPSEPASEPPSQDPTPAQPAGKVPAWLPPFLKAIGMKEGLGFTVELCEQHYGPRENWTQETASQIATAMREIATEEDVEAWKQSVGLADDTEPEPEPEPEPEVPEEDPTDEAGESQEDPQTSKSNDLHSFGPEGDRIVTDDQIIDTSTGEVIEDKTYIVAEIKGLVKEYEEKGGKGSADFIMEGSPKNLHQLSISSLVDLRNALRDALLDLE